MYKLNSPELFRQGSTFHDFSYLLKKCGVLCQLKHSSLRVKGQNKVWRNIIIWKVLLFILVIIGNFWFLKFRVCLQLVAAGFYSVKDWARCRAHEFYDSRLWFWKVNIKLKVFGCLNLDWLAISCHSVIILLKFRYAIKLSLYRVKMPCHQTLGVKYCNFVDLFNPWEKILDHSY